MKYLFLGLFSLALLGFDLVQSADDKTTTEMPSSTMDPTTKVNNQTGETEATGTTGNSNTGSSNTGSGNTGSSNTGSSNTGSSNTGSGSTGSMNTKPTMKTPHLTTQKNNTNGLSHIFTSITLLLGSVGLQLVLQ